MNVFLAYLKYISASFEEKIYWSKIGYFTKAKPCLFYANPFLEKVPIQSKIKLQIKSEDDLSVFLAYLEYISASFEEKIYWSKIGYLTKAIALPFLRKPLS